MVGQWDANLHRAPGGAASEGRAMIGHVTHYSPSGRSARIWGKIKCPQRDYRGKSAFELSRVSGPAFERSDGSKEWRLDGKIKTWQDGNTLWDGLHDLRISSFPGYGQVEP